MPITVLHTGDVHLGAPFKRLSKRALEQRRQLRQTFQKVVDLALERRVDLFLVAGDLFDSNRVSDAEVGFARNQLERLKEANIPAVFIGGTHDCLADAAVLTRQGVLTDLANVTLLTPEHPQKTYPELDLTVSGTSNNVNKSRTSPLAALPKEAGTPMHIGMIHGSLAIPGKHASNDMPFTPEEVAASGVDYLAVGHWHSLNDISSGNVTAYYSGSPEGIDFGEHRAGYVLIVTLEEGKKPEVEPVRVGTRRFERKKLDVTGMTEHSEITRKIMCDADGNCALEIVLSGVRKADFVIDGEALKREMAEHFFQILIKDHTELTLEGFDESAFPEHLVIGQFVRRMRERIEQAPTEEEKQIAEMALQLGIVRLLGKEEQD